MACDLDCCVLAHLGLAKFPSPVRHCRNPLLRRNYFRQPLADFFAGVATIVTGILWGLDAGWRAAFHHNLIGGTEYLWNAAVPLWVRLLSLFHIGLPILLVVLCARIGYDRRALALQSAITLCVMAVSRWMGPAGNLNYAFLDPIFHRALGPASVHFVIIFAGTVLLLYLPAHLILSRKYSYFPVGG